MTDLELKRSHDGEAVRVIYHDEDGRQVVDLFPKDFTNRTAYTSALKFEAWLRALWARAEAAEASLASAHALCDNLARSLRSALAGGTSPEPTEPRRCPDDGFCNHKCAEPYCFRVQHAGPLSGAGFYGNDWPGEIIAKHGRPVDVASEPPNPPKDLYEALGVTPAQQAEMRTHLAAEFERIRESERAAESHQHHVIGVPVGEPLKPTEQEQR